MTRTRTGRAETDLGSMRLRVLQLRASDRRNIWSDLDLGLLPAQLQPSCLEGWAYLAKVARLRERRASDKMGPRARLEAEGASQRLGDGKMGSA